MVLNIIISLFAFVLFVLPAKYYEMHQQNLNLPKYAHVIILVLGGTLGFVLIISWITAFMSALFDDVSGLGFIVLWFEKFLETITI